jgi:hypothetical protein
MRNVFTGVGLITLGQGSGTVFLIPSDQHTWELSWQVQQAESG